MAHTVVDSFKLVQINMQEPDTGVFQSGFFQAMLEMIFEVGTVRQPSQGVEVFLEDQFFLQGSELSQIADNPQRVHPIFTSGQELLAQRYRTQISIPGLEGNFTFPPGAAQDLAPEFVGRGNV
jgi:hypothetical protein